MIIVVARWYAKAVDGLGTASEPIRNAALTMPSQTTAAPPRNAFGLGTAPPRVFRAIRLKTPQDAFLDLLSAGFSPAGGAAASGDSEAPSASLLSAALARLAFAAAANSLTFSF